MNYSLSLAAKPALEPVLVADLKRHSVVPFDDDNDYLKALISVARQQVENDTGRALINQIWRQQMECFGGEITLQKSPASSVPSIKYIDTDGVEQTLPQAGYTFGQRYGEGRICPSYGNSWPEVRSGLGAVTIEFVAGWGADPESVPMPLRQAIMIMAEHLYENRGLAITGTIVSRMPMSYQSLIDPYIRAAV